MTEHHSLEGKFPFEDANRHLVEAAIRNEETISTAAREMRTLQHQLGERVRTLPDWATTEVNRRLAETVDRTCTRVTIHLADVTTAAERARAHYESAAKSAPSKIVLIAFVCFLCGCIGMVFGVYISARVILPAPDVLQRQLAAEQTVEKLAPRGGKSLLNMCLTPQGEKLCIRTDERSKPEPWGQGETYRLIYGY